MINDPFQCFAGSDDNESQSEGQQTMEHGSQLENANSIANDRVDEGGLKRDVGCGVMTFHANTELAMLLHVRNSVGGRMSATCSGWRADLDSADQQEEEGVDEADQILNAIDNFCVTRHWMMNVGPEKGREILVNIGLERALKHYRESELMRRQDCFIAVELGTYIGYSSILIGQRLRREMMRLHSMQRNFGENVSNNSKEGRTLNQSTHCGSFHLYSFEVNKRHAEIAVELVHLTGLDDFIDIIVLEHDAQGTENVVNTASAPAQWISLNVCAGKNESQREKRGNKSSFTNSKQEEEQQHMNSLQVNMLFIDHDKDLYLYSLQAFEQENLLHQNSIVVADNVTWARLDDYKNYVAMKCDHELVTTEIIECNVEYISKDEIVDYGINSLRDGIGEQEAFEIVVL